MTLSELQACVAERWTPQIGDPNVTGWLTVIFYLVAALLSLLVWRRLAGQRGRVFWGILTCILVFLALNKQLDLQSAVTAAGKCVARAQGWYGQRRMLQAGFIGAVLAASVLGLILMTLALRGGVARSLAAMIGLTLLLCFIMIRAISFHGFDHLIGARDLGVPYNFLFENFGLLLIALNAVMQLRSVTPRHAG